MPDLDAARVNLAEQDGLRLVRELADLASRLDDLGADYDRAALARDRVLSARISLESALAMLMPLANEAALSLGIAQEF